MFRSIDGASRVGCDDELLQDGGPRRTDQDAGEDQQHHRDRRQLQVPTEHRAEEGRGADDRDEEQDQLRGHHGVEVRVGGAVEVLVAVGEQQLEPVQVVGDRLEQHEHAREDRELGAGRGRDLARAAAEPDPAEDVVRDDGDDEAHRHDHEQPVQQQPQERQLEGVEADVVAELGIRLAERRGVQEHLHRLPVPLRGEPGDDADGHRDPDAEHLEPRDDHRAVARDGVLGPGDRNEHRPEPVADPQGQRDGAAHEEAAHDELQNPGEQDCGQDAAEAHLAEPQEVDVEVDHPGAPEEHHHEHGGRDEQDPCSAGERRGSHRRPHGHGHAPTSRIGLPGPPPDPATAAEANGCRLAYRGAGPVACPAGTTLRTACGVPV
jgi:hypothetical protein